MNTTVTEKLEQFFSQYKLQKCKKGEILINPNTEPSGVFYLKKGMVRRYSISKSGEEVTLNIFKPISFFPMSWVLNDTISSHYFEAMAVCEVYKAPKEDVLSFIYANPDVVLDLLSRIYRGLEGLMVKMEYLMQGSAYGRVITELLTYAKRFGEIDDNKMIQFRLVQTSLASQTGIARETVSRELQKLAKKNLIEIKKRDIVISDIAKLEAELSQS